MGNKALLKVGSVLVAILLPGCALFVSHYDAGAYQYFTSLKAFHVKFLEDNKSGAGNTFDESKTRSTCDAGDLKFREANEYAAGKRDDTRVKAIRYLYNVFRSDCKLALGSKKLFSDTYVEEKLKEVGKNYDLAIEGEVARVGAPSK